MITTIRHGEVYPFATMDPAVLDEVRDIEWSVHQGRELPDQPIPAHGLVAALRRIFGRPAEH